VVISVHPSSQKTVIYGNWFLEVVEGQWFVILTFFKITENYGFAADQDR
jgi:hypothetical protein